MALQSQSIARAAAPFKRKKLKRFLAAKQIVSSQRDLAAKTTRSQSQT
jgi:hypothetical protein